MENPTKEHLDDRLIFDHFPEPLRSTIKILHWVTMELHRIAPDNNHAVDGFSHLVEASKSFVKAFTQTEGEEPKEHAEHRRSMLEFFREHFLTGK